MEIESDSTIVTNNIIEYENDYKPLADIIIKELLFSDEKKSETKLNMLIDNFKCNVYIIFTVKNNTIEWDLYLFCYEIEIDEGDELEILENVNKYCLFTDSGISKKNYFNNKICIIDIIINELKKIYEIINELKYDNKNGIFVKNNIELLNNFNAEEFVFKKFFEYKENISEEKNCSVCMEITNTETYCKHKLCINCWKKIQKKCNCCSNVNNFCKKICMNCPICRKCICKIDGTKHYNK